MKSVQLINHDVLSFFGKNKVQHAMSDLKKVHVNGKILWTQKSGAGSRPIPLDEGLYLLLALMAQKPHYILRGSRPTDYLQEYFNKLNKIGFLSDLLSHFKFGLVDNISISCCWNYCSFISLGEKHFYGELNDNEPYVCVSQKLLKNYYEVLEEYFEKAL